MTDPQEREGRWGVQHRYYAYDGTQLESPRSSVDAVLSSMGAEEGEPAAHGPVVLRQGQHWQPHGEWTVVTESGREMRGDGPLPPDMDLGYHRLHDHGGERLLVIAPDACPEPPGKRAWGWSVQLYSMRSRSSWGIGDLSDLKQFARLARERKAHLVLLNPLHAALPGFPQEPSPYYPSSRCFENPLYLGIDAIAGVEELGSSLDVCRRAGRALNADRRIDRDQAWRLKLDALRRIYDVAPRRTDVDRFMADAGKNLEHYATFCALVDEHGRDWRQWPQRFRNPKNEAVLAFAGEREQEIRFHAWLQMNIDEQLASADAELSLMHDLAIGVDPVGADAWLWQDVFALDMRVGAPPDEFNTRGQNWSLPPFDPWKLRAHDYEPLIATLRSAFTSSAAVRIDHVMGLFRLFWIPVDATAADGVYVSYPHDDMLAILALEAHRAGSFVVGEDLGTVEPYMRKALAANRILSYKLLWFENDEPEHFPERSMAAVTTHDLPTIAGVLSGRDLEVQQELELAPNVESSQRLADRVRQWVGDGDQTEQVHRRLGRAASEVVTATLEDALQLKERPNYPGTVDEWPNWSVALPVPLEDLVDNSRLDDISRALNENRIGTEDGPNEAS